MRRLLLLGLTLAFFLSLSGAAFAGVTIYLDKAEWQADVGGEFETEDFSDTLLNDGVSYVSSESGNINTKFGYYHDVLNSDSAKAPSTTWIFDSEITAFGGTWTLGGPGGSGNSLLVYINDLETPVGFISNNFNGDFWGFVSETPFTEVLLVGGTGSNQQIYKLDDMVYSFGVGDE